MGRNEPERRVFDALGHCLDFPLLFLSVISQLFVCLSPPSGSGEGVSIDILIRVCGQT